MATVLATTGGIAGNRNHTGIVHSDSGTAATTVHSLKFDYRGVLQGNLDIPQDPFTVKVFVDGYNRVVETTGGTVEEILEEANVDLGHYDIVNLPLHRKVEAGEQIVVERREYRTVTVEEEIPYETQEIPTSLLSTGKTRVLAEGQSGVEVAIYEQYVIDGEVQEETLVAERVETTPVSQTVLIGSAAAPISDLDFEYEFENGVPVGYQTVLSGCRAAGYSARAGAGTASGRPARVGHVAVNPNVIPYGTKLYIASPDGQFVYGYAIAADTGTALRDGIIDVDLFYGSYTESALNSIRTVDIYILEYPG